MQLLNHCPCFSQQPQVEQVPDNLGPPQANMQAESASHTGLNTSRACAPRDRRPLLGGQATWRAPPPSSCAGLPSAPMGGSLGSAAPLLPLAGKDPFAAGGAAPSAGASVIDARPVAEPGSVLEVPLRLELLGAWQSSAGAACLTGDRAAV